MERLPSISVEAVFGQSLMQILTKFKSKDGYIVVSFRMIGYAIMCNTKYTFAHIQITKAFLYM